VRQRKAWLAAHPEPLAFSGLPKLLIGSDPTQSPGIVRRWLGDAPQRVIILHQVSLRERAVISNLFPESAVVESP
jgi:hypothetical protein